MMYIGVTSRKMENWTEACEKLAQRQNYFSENEHFSRSNKRRNFVRVDEMKKVVLQSK